MGTNPNQAAMRRYTVRLMSVMTVYVAALIGGLFTVAGILDASLYHSSKKLKKMQEGRQD